MKGFTKAKSRDHRKLYENQNQNLILMNPINTTVDVKHFAFSVMFRVIAIRPNLLPVMSGTVNVYVKAS